MIPGYSCRGIAVLPDGAGVQPHRVASRAGAREALSVEPVRSYDTGPLLDAELVAFRVGHDDMFGSRFLDLPENCGAKFPEPGDLTVAVVRAGVQIKVQSVLDRLGLGHLLEKQPPPSPTPVPS
jgi:hypothetical protein